jgi:glyceraldehyde 3-phosphate dehydrogenase
MNMIKVAINGFGRIGRQAFKVALDKHSQEVEIVAVNDLTDTKTLAHLLQYDSSYGKYSKEVTFDDQNIIVAGKKIRVYAEKDPRGLPWSHHQVDVVIESTGIFTDLDGMQKHLDAGAKKVVLSAPAKGDGVGTFLIGVNESKYKGEKLINNASCTTNCISPVIGILHSHFKVLKSLMSTVHGYTQDQNLQDGPHRDLRRARAAALNIVPTTTGAAVATTEAIPELKNLFDGTAFRVPVSVGSISYIVAVVEKKTSVEEVNSVFEKATENPIYKGVLAVTREPLVSSDVVGRSESSIVDLELTKVIDGDLVQIVAWYDNEYGYSNRLVEQVINIGKS